MLKHRKLWHQITIGIATCILLLLPACSSDITVVKPDLATKGFWKVALNYRAVTLTLTGPDSTIQLIAVPQNVDGEPLAERSTTRYTSSDRGVAVSQAGLVEAIARTDVARIVAFTTVGSLTLVDTVLVRVLSTVPASPVASLSLHADSTTIVIDPIGLVGGMNLKTSVLDENHNPIPDALVRYWSSNPRIIAVSSLGSVSASALGSATIYASATVLGKTVQDSLVLNTTYPLVAFIQVDFRMSAESATPVAVFNPKVLTVIKGADVMWAIPSSGLVDVVFDQPSEVTPVENQILKMMLDPETQGGGNIPPWKYERPNPRSIYRARHFANSGIYTYRSTLYPNSIGTILVK